MSDIILQLGSLLTFPDHPERVFNRRAGALYRALGYPIDAAHAEYRARRAQGRTPEEICADLTSELAPYL